MKSAIVAKGGSARLVGPPLRVGLIRVGRGPGRSGGTLRPRCRPVGVRGSFGGATLTGARAIRYGAGRMRLHAGGMDHLNVSAVCPEVILLVDQTGT